MVMDPHRAALLFRCEDAYRGIREASCLNTVILAIQRAEAALAALILSLEPDDLETSANLARLTEFRSLSRSMRRIG
jgi:hypothetical protein